MSSDGGSGKARCAVCGYESHVLLQHLREEHNMSAIEYAEKYPGSPVFSALGSEILKTRIQGSTALSGPDRDYTVLTVEDLMGWKGETVMKVKKYEDLSPWVPPGDDEGYHYDYDATMTLLYGLHRERRNSVWISGYSGTGKTQLVTNVCRRLNREMVRINLDSSVTRSDLIGDWVVRDGATTFNYGLLPQAMSRGAVLLLDEFDLGNPYVISLFRPVLEEHPRLVVLENGGEVIVPHPDFRVVVTANTFGAGDETGLYGTTHALSLADRQRFSLFIQMEYLRPNVEERLLLDAVPDLEEDEAEMMVKVANSIRELFKERKIEESISPRQLVNFAEIFSESGRALSAANMTFLLPLSQSSQIAIRQLLEESGLVKKED